MHAVGDLPADGHGGGAEVATDVAGAGQGLWVAYQLADVITTNTDDTRPSRQSTSRTVGLLEQPGSVDGRGSG